MTLRITLKRVLIALAMIGLGGLLFAWSGLMQVSASSGHWRVTDWFLHFVMRSSVRTYAAVDTPDVVIDRGAMISAAGHFAQACAVCHGAPGIKPSPIMQAATPPAPDLALNAGQWSDRKLFWIIRHGVKYTGMPAWPADRPDEVARMVGFVRALPTMTPDAYRALLQVGSAQRGFVTGCTTCHGADGQGRGQRDIPIIAGQSEAYLLASLRDYASGKRQSGPMEVAAAALSPDDMVMLARYFSALPGLRQDKTMSHDMITRGDPAQQVPACAGCHAPGKTCAAGASLCRVPCSRQDRAQPHRATARISRRPPAPMARRPGDDRCA